MSGKAQPWLNSSCDFSTVDLEASRLIMNHVIQLVIL